LENDKSIFLNMSHVLLQPGILVAAQNLKRQWIGIDISSTACRVMAKRLRDVRALPESEPLWRAGRGFVVRP
jgi:hypothetical protein